MWRSSACWLRSLPGPERKEVTRSFRGTAASTRQSWPGLKTLPVIVRNMSDDEAVIHMVDSNLQREHILPSERAFAYKMKLEAIKNQGARSDLTSCQVGTKFRADAALASGTEESARNVQRFIRLTNLIPELLDLVDQKKISFNPAVELSYLTASEQRDFLEAMQDTQNAPLPLPGPAHQKTEPGGPVQLRRYLRHHGGRKEGRDGPCDHQKRCTAEYFPRSYTPKQMQDTIIKLLEQWQKKRQRSQER